MISCFLGIWTLSSYSTLALDIIKLGKKLAELLNNPIIQQSHTHTHTESTHRTVTNSSFCLLCKITINIDLWIILVNHIIFILFSLFTMINLRRTKKHHRHNLTQMMTSSHSVVSDWWRGAARLRPTLVRMWHHQLMTNI